MNSEDSEALRAFVREIVGELYGRIPEAADAGDGEPTAMMVAQARMLSESVVGDSPYASDVTDAVVLYTFAVAAVRWPQCPLSRTQPQMAGAFLGEMISRTGSASKRVAALADQFRLAPYRGRELNNLAAHVRDDGTVDFASWESEADDPDLVRFLGMLA